MLRRVPRRGMLRTDGTCLRRRYSSSRVVRCMKGDSSSGSSGSSTSAISALWRNSGNSSSSERSQPSSLALARSTASGAMSLSPLVWAVT